MFSNIADYLRSKLSEKGWRQVQLARKAKLTTGPVSNWLGGTGRPDPKSCLKIAIALDDDPVEILRLSGHSEFADVFEKFLPRDIGTLTEDDLYRNSLHAALHEKMQNYLDANLEDEVEDALEQLNTDLAIELVSKDVFALSDQKLLEAYQSRNAPLKEVIIHDELGRRGLLEGETRETIPAELVSQKLKEFPGAKLTTYRRYIKERLSERVIENILKPSEGESNDEDISSKKDPPESHRSATGN